MNIKEIEKAVAALQRTIFKKSSTVNDGLLKSNLKGSGLHFKEHQVYHPGDDVRFIDWKLSARANNVYIKTFEEDRNIELVVILDITQYMYYGSDGVSKLQAALEIVALLYFVAQQSQDLIRLIILKDEKIELPPSRGKPGLVMLLTELEKRQIIQNGKVNEKIIFIQKFSTKDKVTIVRGWLARRKEVLLLADLGDLEGDSYFEKILKEAKFHVVRLLSPIDEEALRFSIPQRFRNGGVVGRSRPEVRKPHKRLLTLRTNEKYLDRFIKDFK